jgi:hypothetical protein
MRWLYLPFLVLALASCASLSEEECRAADWFQIGVTDGAEGRGPERLEAHRRACADLGIAPDAERWLQGRERGLRLYCTPQKAYEVGRRGASIGEGCTSAELTRMRPAHDWGRAYWRVGLEIDSVESDIRDINSEIAVLPPDSGSTLARLLAERSRLISRLGLLELEQSRYSSWP